ncbi:hypothetical protein [Mesorhizobium sp. CAU 1732]|uniref:hypothetical protein n=1 Tax=Mesorhizobium sp. CAU 1732 TaxID=3140358 RepID=UPI0032603097
MAVVGFFLMVSGVLWGIWWKIDGQVKDRVREVRDDCDKKADAAVNLAALARSDLADFKLDASKTYATKAGMQEQTAQLLRAIESIGGRIDHIGERIDNIIMQQQKPSTRRSG